MAEKIIADLHIHGRYSGGTSSNLSIDNLEKYARIKGVNLLGTGDFTHPKWIKELKSSLSDDEGRGIFSTKTGFNFLLQTEISLMYSQNNKGRRIHILVYSPDFDTVEQITDELLKHGRVDYDGRPIFNIPSPDFVEMLKKINNKIEVIPAHIWTPHFSMFGEYNQFNTVEECFKDQTKHLFAMETGLSSDPAMNWRLSQLDKYNLVSFSDLHSYWPWRIGREATIFKLKKLNYDNLFKAMKKKDDSENKILETVEVDPSYGKYHYDGHRNCNVSFSPMESIKHKNICPVCKKPLTIGVLHRVEQLADREEGFVLKNSPGFKTLIPLSELLSKALGKGISTKAVWQEYNKIVNENNEFDILLNKSRDDLLKMTSQKIADYILMNRKNLLKVIPGYDGVYGKLVLDEDNEEVVIEKKKAFVKQKSLGDF